MSDQDGDAAEWPAQPVQPDYRHSSDWLEQLSAQLDQVVDQLDKELNRDVDGAQSLAYITDDFDWKSATDMTFDWKS